MEATKSADVSPDEQLGDLLGGFVGTQLLYVVTELGVADALGDGAQSIEALAESVRECLLTKRQRLLLITGCFQ